MRTQRDLPPLPPQPRVRGRKPHDPSCDVRTALYYLTGVDRTALEGLDERHARTLVSALGTAFSKWPTVKHFSSWRGKVSGTPFLLWPSKQGELQLRS
jgi:hypothetical protein